MVEIVTKPPQEERLGRLPSADPRDAQYPLRAALPRRVTLPRSKYWANFSTPPLDQLDTGTCVAHGLKNWMLTAPVIQTKRDGPPQPYTMYRGIILLDEWTQNDIEAAGPDSGLQFGTSIHAMARWAQAEGYIAGDYRWSMTNQDTIDWVSVKGPMVIGVNWYGGMFNPDANGYLNLEGGIAGGHCVAIVGVNNVRKDFTILNSWGRWGIEGKGRALVRFSDMARLLEEAGEFMTGLEVRLPKKELPEAA